MPTRLDSCQIGFNSRRTRLIQPESGCIGHIRLYLKSALNMAGKSETCLLLYFFCELRHSNVFFKNILIVKIYRKYNKNIFNNFLIVKSRRTCTILFQKLPSPAPAPESRNAPMLHIYIYIYCGVRLSFINRPEPCWGQFIISYFHLQATAAEINCLFGQLQPRRKEKEKGWKCLTQSLVSNENIQRQERELETAHKSLKNST